MSFKKAEKKQKKSKKNWGSRTGSRKGTRRGSRMGSRRGFQKGSRRGSRKGPNGSPDWGVHILYRPQPQDKGKKTCNCRNKQECPLEGECLVSDVVYQATVKTQNAQEMYIGLTSNYFKTTRCHLGTLRGKTRQNSANTCGG